MKFEINISNILVITSCVLGILKLFGLVSLTWLQVCMPVIIMFAIEFGIVIVVTLLLCLLFAITIFTEPKATCKDKIDELMKELEKIKDSTKW